MTLFNLMTARNLLGQKTLLAMMLASVLSCLSISAMAQSYPGANPYDDPYYYTTGENARYYWDSNASRTQHSSSFLGEVQDVTNTAEEVANLQSRLNTLTGLLSMGSLSPELEARTRAGIAEVSSQLASKERQLERAKASLGITGEQMVRDNLQGRVEFNPAIGEYLDRQGR